MAHVLLVGKLCCWEIVCWIFRFLSIVLVWFSDPQTGLFQTSKRQQWLLKRWPSRNDVSFPTNSMVIFAIVLCKRVPEGNYLRFPEMLLDPI